MKKYVLSFAAITVLGMSYSLFTNQADLYSNSSGAPAPGNCTSCHSGTLQTSSDIMLEVLDGSTAVTSYTPGKTYTISVMAHNFTNTRFGFALSATAGTLIAGTGSQKISNYLTHTSSGNAADAGGGKTWTAQWTAPASGTANFQLFVNATNHDNDDTGDKIYGKSLSLAKGTTGVADIMNEKSLSVYPNPASDVLNIDFDLKESAMVTIDMLDINGKRVKSLAGEKMSSGKQELSYKNDLPQGLYLVHITAGEQVFTKRVVIK